MDTTLSAWGIVKGKSIIKTQCTPCSNSSFVRSVLGYKTHLFFIFRIGKTVTLYGIMIAVYPFKIFFSANNSPLINCIKHANKVRTHDYI